tara:strand:- start:2934 stop:4523 length:1590 start_codon:yes stop_codon:yes gene_type:complete
MSKFKNIVSIFAGHDANITFYNRSKNEYHIIELERLVRKRYFRLHVDNTQEEIEKILLEARQISEKHWNIENDYEVVLIGSDGWIKPKEIITRIFNTRQIRTIAKHHQTHAASAFYQSNFEEALIFSYDGGGDDGFFNIYKGNKSKNRIKLIKNIKSDFGGGYLLCASLIREVAEKSRHQLALSGKMMGICAYGNPQKELIKYFKEFFFDRNYKKLSCSTDLNLKNIDNPWQDPLQNWTFEGQAGFNIAATAQAAFEECVVDILREFDSKEPLIITGGCALNVLVNERIKLEFDREIFVPPNPHDGGLSLGHIFCHNQPNKIVNLTYSGLPLLDKDNLAKYIDEYDARKITKKYIAKLLKEGNIIGIVYEDSEVGPRALGNRSIICDPNFKEMKDILNSKIKFREWFRPFAPFCKKEDAKKYFESKNFENLDYMGYAPKVKKEYSHILPSITHIDNTARLQTVTEENNKNFYHILSEFGKIRPVNVLLNTSFNINGLPILSTIKDAIYVLENTKIDYVVIEDYLFEKSK